MLLSKTAIKVIDWIAVVLLVSAAIVVVTLRLYLPSLDNHKTQILAYLNQQLGTELSIDHVQATWRHFSPVLITKGVIIKNSHLHQVAKVDEMQLSVDFWNSLWHGDLHLNKISVTGASIDLRGSTHTGSGQTQVSTSDVENTVAQIFGTQQGDAEFHHINIKIDVPQGKYATLYIDDLRWKNVDRTHQLSGDIDLKIDQTQLKLKGTVFVYLGASFDWGVETNQVGFQLNEGIWHPFSVKYLRRGMLNTLNVDHLSLADFSPMIGYFYPGLQSDKMQNNIINGQIKDVRVAWGRELTSPRFSFKIEDIATKETPVLPKVEHLSIFVAGDQHAGRIQANIADKTSIGSTYFSDHLDISAFKLNLFWQKHPHSYKLWADKMSLLSPNLDIDGQFLLDIPQQGAPFLSAYSSLSLKKGKHLVDYFPKNTLGSSALSFLKNGIKAGYSEHGHALWFGALDQYPFSKHQGVFQVRADLKDVTLAFSPMWPVLTRLNTQFEMHNQDISLVADQAHSMGISSHKIKVDIPHILHHSQVNLSGDLWVKNSEDAQQYLLKTPLSHSVAPALDAVSTNEPMAIKLNLSIPFSGKDYRAWGQVNFNKNTLDVATPKIKLKQVQGQLSFDNEKITIRHLSGNLYQQPITLQLNGAQKGKDYQIKIGVKGNWDLQKLNHLLDLNALNYLRGNSFWDLGVDLGISKNDVDFKVNGWATTNKIKSDLPYPLSSIATNKQGVAQQVKVQLFGNGQGFSMHIDSPKLAYHSTYVVDDKDLNINASVLSVGQKTQAPIFKKQHPIYVTADSVDGDRWLPIIFDIIASKPHQQDSQGGLPIGSPQHIYIKVSDLILGGIHWHNSDIDMQRKKGGWSLKIKSDEAVGVLDINDHQPWVAKFKKLFVFYRAEQKKSQPSLPGVSSGQASLLDKDIFKQVPNIDVQVDDFWFQGYSLGKITGKIQRVRDKIIWKDVLAQFGETTIKTHGQWHINNGMNYTQNHLHISTKKSNDILDRVGINGGIQNAQVDFSSDLKWQGTLWGIQRNTLNGQAALSMKNGIIKSISGATNLVGILSLNSLLKRLRLDFSGIFDNGLVVDKLDTHAMVKDGILSTDDSEIKVAPGDLHFKGTMDFIKEQLDFKVKFTPDFTSGLPVITAFAISPPVGAIAFAITKLLSPVLDVITDINYRVTGSFYSPKVEEVSRKSGKVSLPQTEE